MTLVTRLRLSLRSAVYPGLDLHTRHRAVLCRFWKTGPRDVLDAGSGNGYFSWLAYQSGARVTALNVEPGQVRRATEYLLGHRRADPRRLRFEHGNLYSLPEWTQQFDEIICYEVLEHVRGDREVVAQFFRLLRPGGAVHLCCPHRLHPRHQAEVLDHDETGGHVRAGYTEADYRALLEPVGFQIETVVGIGPRSVCVADRVLRATRNRIGDVAALPLFLLTLPFTWFAGVNPSTPFSLYVRAVKPLER